MDHGADMPTKLVSVSGEATEKKMIEVPDPIGRISGISSKDLPEILDWAVGHSYLISVKVKQSSTRTADVWEVEHDNAKIGEIFADFDIIGIQAAPAEQQPGVVPALPAPK